MSISYPKFAAYVALSYVAVVLGGILIHYLQSGDTYTLKFSLLLPSTLIALLIASTLAWGLWNKYRWAWWLGFVVSTAQLLRMSMWLWHHFVQSGFPGPGVLLVLAILVLFVALLLLPGTRAACTR